MTLYYATTNKGKIASLQRHLAPHAVTVEQVPIDIPEPRSDDVQQIVREKVIYAYAMLRKPVVALDAGFYIPSLNGFPRAFVNFALDTVGLDGILKLVEGKDRACEFRECLAYMGDSTQEPVYFVGKVHGTIAQQPRGTLQPHHWSKLATIFQPQGSDRTLAEWSFDEYKAWRLTSEESSSSHLFAVWYAQNFKNS